MYPYQPYTTVSYYDHRWLKEGVLQRIHDALRAEVRCAAGRNPEPRVGIIDSQSVACAPRQGGGATPRETTGYDPAKRVKGRKRFVEVDTQGWIWGLAVLPASAHETHGGRWVVAQACVASSRVRPVWADTAYKGSFEEAIAQAWGVEVGIVQRHHPSRRADVRTRPRAYRRNSRPTLPATHRYPRLSRATDLSFQSA